MDKSQCPAMDSCDRCGEVVVKFDLTSLQGMYIFYCPPCYEHFEEMMNEPGRHTTLGGG